MKFFSTLERRSFRFKAQKRASGSALVAVFWLMSILSLAVFAAVRVVSFDVDAVASQTFGVRAKQVAEMGIAVGSHPKIEENREDVLNRSFPEFDESYSVTISSEGGRFNLNAVLLGWATFDQQPDKRMLRDLFTDKGLELDEADALIDALTDWVDGDDEEALNGAEGNYYLGQGFRDLPFNRPFYSLEEARMVRGMDRLEEVFPAWRNWFTVWSEGKLDIHEASAEMLSVAMEVSLEIVSIIPETIRGPDGIKDTEDDEELGIDEALGMVSVPSEIEDIVKARLTEKDNRRRVTSIGRASSAKRKITVVMESGNGQSAILDRVEEVVP